MNYPKCPACGNPEVNQFASGKFHCPYCGTAFASDGSICEKPVGRPVERPVMNETAVPQNAVQGNDGAGKSKSHKALLLGVGALVVGAIVFAVVKGVSTKSNAESSQADVAVTEATASFSTGTENGHEYVDLGSTKSFLTQDLRMHNFFGKVKTVKTMITDCGADQKPIGDQREDWSRLEYDAEGHFVKYLEGFTTTDDIKQKDGDKIIRTETLIEDYGVSVICEYTYDDNGLVKTEDVKGIECNSITEYTYNDDCELTQTLEHSSGEGQNLKIRTSYQILKRDEQGNWTERFATIETETAAWDSNKQDYGAFQKEENRYELQQRTINYWE